MPTIELDQTISIAMSVADRNASAEWYSQHLGFELLFSSDEMGWSEMQTKTEGVTIGFGDAESPKPGNCVPVFGVANVDAARKALEDGGVQFDGDVITAEGMVKITTFYDPDNNALMIAEDLSGGK